MQFVKKGTGKKIVRPLLCYIILKPNKREIPSHKKYDTANVQTLRISLYTYISIKGVKVVHSVLVADSLW